MSRPAAMTPETARDIREANVRMFERLAPVFDCRCYDHLDKAHVRWEFGRTADKVLGELRGRNCDAGLGPPHIDLKPRVLDVGCGTGFLSLIFASKGARVTALDATPGLLERLRAKLDAAGPLAGKVEPVLADADAFLESGEPGSSWDVIVFCSVLHHLPNYEATLEKALRRLAPGGVLYIWDVFSLPLRAAPRPGRGLRRALNERFLAWNTRLDWTWKTWRFGAKIPNPDGHMAEFHVTHGGMRHEGVVRVLDAAGMKLVPLPGGQLHELRYLWLWAAARLASALLGPADETNALLAVKGLS